MTVRFNLKDQKQQQQPNVTTPSIKVLQIANRLKNLAQELSRKAAAELNAPDIGQRVANIANGLQKFAQLAKQASDLSDQVSLEILKLVAIHKELKTQSA